MEILSALPLPLPALIAIAAGVVALIAAAAILALQRHRFIQRLIRGLDNGIDADLFLARYNPKQRLARSGLIEKLAHREGAAVMTLTDLPALWLQRLEQKGRKADFQRVLQYAPEKSLMPCLLLSLQKEKLAPLFQKHLEHYGDDLTIRRTALSGRGENFDGSQALKLFSDHLDQMRELTGDPEWPVRFFVYKMLLHDDDPRSRRSLREALTDPYPLIRKTLIREFMPEEREEFYSILQERLLDDPVFEVRQAAKKRIQSDFMDLYDTAHEGLEGEQVLHYLELLAPESSEDENRALSYLTSENLEWRLEAALFLQKSGMLKKLFLAPEMGNREDMDQKKNLLEKACEVHVCGFLTHLRESDNPGTLFLAAEMLRRWGNREHIIPLARKVFSAAPEGWREGDYRDVYRGVILALADRGSEEALKLYAAELEKPELDEERLALLLDHVPVRAEHLFIEQLLRFLKTPDFAAPEKLRQVLLRVSPSLVLEEVIEILRIGREVYPHAVRIEALKLLGAMKKGYCLQRILENLPILPLEEGEELARMLAAYSAALFEERAGNLLDSADAVIRGALISALPATGIKKFLPRIKEAMQDPDPEVRMASVQALMRFEDTRSLNQASFLLRDPVERVRTEAARILGMYASGKGLEEMKAILTDDNEVEPVKLAAVRGLGYCEGTEAIDILVDRLEEDPALEKAIIAALRHKSDRKGLIHLVESFKDAGHDLREKLSLVFKQIGEEAEPTLLQLLAEDIPSLVPYLTEILYETGYIDTTIKKLSHRKAKVRRKAAAILSAIGTKPAFKGIVLAAKDPDEEVRVNVVKALEKLNTPDGKEILEALEQDPDKRVRKYTHWALQRLIAKNQIEDRDETGDETVGNGGEKEE